MSAEVDFEERLRLGIYRSLAEVGRAPDTVGLARQLGVADAAIRDGLRRLHDARHLVLDESGTVLLAHPFASASFGFAVMGSRTLWWGGCAWDSFAIPHLVDGEPDVLVSTRCPTCNAALSWVIGRDGPPEGDEVAHFLVPMARVWADVVTACENQRLFCSPDCVHTWLQASCNEQGYVMDLATLWRLAEHWYDGRLDAGYVRREPDQARDYFRDVGLAGPFWGL